IPDEMAKGNVPMYALRVQGDSMIEAGINNVDIAIIEKRDIARNGEIVVALIEDEATLKVYYKEQDQIRLEARNPKYKPIKTKKATIMGKLIGLYRIY
ncbi:SOS-response transcriptional repressor LexA1, partial [Leptospira kirschneri]